MFPCIAKQDELVLVHRSRILKDQGARAWMVWAISVAVTV